MELPDDMAEEIKALIRKIEEKGIVRETDGGYLGALKMGGRDYSKWIQVGTLTSHEKMERNKALRRGHEIAAEDRILYAKHQRLMAEVDELQAVLWHHIEKGHSLPRANFHLEESGKILMEPGSVKRGEK